MRLTKHQVIDRLKSGERLHESGNMYLFDDGGYVNSWTAMWLLESSRIKTSDQHYPKTYIWQTDIRST